MVRIYTTLQEEEEQDEIYSALHRSSKFLSENEGNMQSNNAFGSGPRSFFSKLQSTALKKIF